MMLLFKASEKPKCACCVRACVCLSTKNRRLLFFVVSFNLKIFSKS